MKKNKSSLVKKTLEVNAEKYCTKFNRRHDLKNIEDLEKYDVFIKSINEKIKKNNVFHTRIFKSIYDFSVYRNLIYYIIRDLKPEIVLETGVFHGLTSAWILKALHDNKLGKLISIDLPRRDWDNFFPNTPLGPGHQDEDELPDNENPGWVIPDALRKRWELVIGPSSQKMEQIVNNNKINVFIHDSDHSYETYKYEVDLVLNSNNNALIIADNYDMNSYTYEYLSANDIKHIFVDDVNDFLGTTARCIIMKNEIGESSHQLWSRQLEARKLNVK